MTERKKEIITHDGTTISLFSLLTIDATGNINIVSVPDEDPAKEGKKARGVLLEFHFSAKGCSLLGSSTLTDIPNDLILALFEKGYTVVAVSEGFLEVYCKMSKKIEDVQSTLKNIITKWNKKRKKSDGSLEIELLKITCFYKQKEFEKITLTHFQNINVASLKQITLKGGYKYFLCDEMKMLVSFLKKHCEDIKSIELEKKIVYNSSTLDVSDRLFRIVEFPHLEKLNLKFLENVEGFKWKPMSKKIKELRVIHCEYFGDHFFQNNKFPNLKILELKHLRKITGLKWDSSVDNVENPIILNCNNYRDRDKNTGFVNSSVTTPETPLSPGIGGNFGASQSFLMFEKKKKKLAKKKNFFKKFAEGVRKGIKGKIGARLKPTLVKELTEKKVQNWDVDDVLRWISTLQFTKREQEVLLEFVFLNNITGKRLMALKFRDFRQEFQAFETRYANQNPTIGGNTEDTVFVKYCRNKFHAYTQHLQETKKCEDSDWYVVFSKLLNTFPDNKKSNPPPLTNFIEYSDIVSRKEEFYNVYFMPFIKIITIRKEYEDILKKFKRKIYRKKKFNQDEFYTENKDKFENLCAELRNFKNKYEKKTGEPLNTNYLKILPNFLREGFQKKEDKKEEEIPYIGEEDIQSPTSTQGPGFGNIWELGGGMKYLRVKLVVSEIFKEYEEEKRKFREFISPVISKIPMVKQKFGMFHTSLIVGPWYLDWNTSELIIPKQFISSHAFFALDVSNVPLYLSDKFSLEEVSRKIVDIVFKWNTDFSYSRLKGKNQGNCQNFVDEVCKMLGVKSLERDSMMRSFFTQLRKNGKATVEFAPSKEFTKYFNLDFKTKIFDTHSELDLFVKDIMAKEQNLENLFSAEYYFLKAIDRAFWLKLRRYKNSVVFQPLKTDVKSDGESSGYGCPFKNPQDTLSFMEKDRSMLDYIHI